MSDTEDGPGGANEEGENGDVALLIEARAAEIVAATKEGDDVRLHPTIQDVDRGIGLNIQLRQELIEYQTRFESDDMKKIEAGLDMSSFVSNTIRGVFNSFFPQRDLPEVDDDAVELLTQLGVGFQLERVHAGEIVSRMRGGEKLTRADIVTGDVIRRHLAEVDGDAKKARYHKEDAERDARFAHGVCGHSAIKTDIYSLMEEDRVPGNLVVKEASTQGVVLMKDEEKEKLVKNCSFVSDVPMQLEEEAAVVVVSRPKRKSTSPKRKSPRW